MLKCLFRKVPLTALMAATLDLIWLSSHPHSSHLPARAVVQIPLIRGVQLLMLSELEAKMLLHMIFKGPLEPLVACNKYLVASGCKYYLTKNLYCAPFISVSIFCKLWGSELLHILHDELGRGAVPDPGCCVVSDMTCVLLLSIQVNSEQREG